MDTKTTFLRLESDQEIREHLLEIISEYQVHFQAMQGVGTKIINPFSSLDQVVRKYVNPLSLFLNDIRRQIENHQLTYIESLEKIALFSCQTRFRDEVIAAVKELEVIEKERPYFLYALQGMVDAKEIKERGGTLEECHRNLRQLNKKYQKKFGGGKEVDVIPWRIKFNKSEGTTGEGTYNKPNAVQLTGFKNVIINLSHNLNSHPRFLRFYHFHTRREVKKDIIRIAELLFDFGFTVEKIASGHQASIDRSYIEHLLNDYLLSKLEKTASRIKTIKEISHHIFRLSLLNLKNIIPIRDFCKITNYNKALAFARKIEKVEKGKRIYRRIAMLYQKYKKNPNCVVVEQFLNFIFSRAHYDYRGRQTISFGADFSKTFIFPSYFNAQDVQEKAQEEITGYSSKGKEEMLALLQLLLNSLLDPHQFRNKELVVLGDIQSGAMGRVSIGIYKGNIVAFKKPASDPGARDFPRLLKFLKHESRIHGDLLQKDSFFHNNIVECYGLVKDNGNVMLALGYYPADNLENLIDKNRTLSADHHAEIWEGLTLEIIRRLFMQLIDALLYLKEKMVIHRDLKPANILFLTDQTGVLNTMKIIDFGVAISLNPEYATDAFENKTVGTLNYMAPEQLMGQEGYESDVYSLGAIMYALLTGRVPISLEGTKNVKEKLRIVFRGERTPILQANQNLKAEPGLVELSGIIDQMVSLEPKNRPTLEALQEKLKTLWLNVTDPKRFSMPLRYEKKSGGVDPDSIQRTTTDAMELGEFKT